MEEKNNELEIKISDFWDVFLRCWWLMLAVGVVACIVLFIALNAVHVDEYTAKTSIYVMRDKGENQTSTTTSDVSIANNLIDDCLLVARSDRVLEAVQIETGSFLSTEKLNKMLKLSTETGTHLVYIEVTANDPETAKLLADSIAKNVEEVVNNYLFENERYVRLMDEAPVPAKPSNPISKIKILAIAFACAVVVYGIFFALYLFDDKINDEDDIEKYLGLSLLGEIPNRSDAHRRKKGYGYYASSEQKKG